MDYEQKIEYCEKLFAQDYKIDEKVAASIISDYDLYDTVLEVYEDELKEHEMELYAEAVYNEKHYNDGWSDHIGV